jgi:hypothetical protein
VCTRCDPAGVTETDQAAQTATHQKRAATTAYTALDLIRLDVAKTLKKLIYSASPLVLQRSGDGAAAIGWWYSDSNPRAAARCSH